MGGQFAFRGQVIYFPGSVIFPRDLHHLFQMAGCFDRVFQFVAYDGQLSFGEQQMVMIVWQDL